MAGIGLTDLCPLCAANVGTRSHLYPAVTAACCASVLFVRLMKHHGLTFILLLQLRAVRLTDLCPVCAANEGTRFH